MITRKVKKTVIHCKRNQSQNVGQCETLPEINLLQVQVPSQNNTRARIMHSPQSGCYDHVTSEILTCVPNCNAATEHYQLKGDTAKRIYTRSKAMKEAMKNNQAYYPLLPIYLQNTRNLPTKYHAIFGR